MEDTVIVTPGEQVAAEAGFLQGHGTYVEDGNLVSVVAGVVERVNRLVSVKPLHGRYVGEVGDVVVGRVREVGAKRWKVHVGARLDAVLQLASVNLEGGDLRRRTHEDQLAMRTYYAEDDLVSAEVHSLQHDGSLSLHARSQKYGKLENGMLAVVPPYLIRRLKHHFVSLPCGVDAIIGVNGHIWITESFTDEQAAAMAAAEAGGAGGDGLLADATAGIAEAVERKKRYAAQRVIGPASRLKLARVFQSIAVLKEAEGVVEPDSIMEVYSASERAGMAPGAMLDAENYDKLVAHLRGDAE